MPKDNSGTHQGDKSNVTDASLPPDPKSKRTLAKVRLGDKGNRGNVKAGKRRGQG